jgi:hypothetical protein
MIKYICKAVHCPSLKKTDENKGYCYHPVCPHGLCVAVKCNDVDMAYMFASSTTDETSSNSLSSSFQNNN